MSGILGQIAPAAASLEDLYTVPANKVGSVRVIVTNRGGSDTTFRVAIAPGGETNNDKHYIAFDKPILANDTGSTVAFIVAETDVVRVYAGNASLSFNIVGETRDE